MNPSTLVGNDGILISPPPTHFLLGSGTFIISRLINGAVMPRPTERARAPSHTPANLQPPSFPGQQNETRRKSNHVEHREFGLRSKRIHYLKAQSHDPMKLVKNAVASFHNTTWTDEQIQALKEWHSWYHAWFDRDATKTPDEN